MCDCIKKIDTALAEHNGMLETNFLSDPPRALLSTCKRQMRERKKPPIVEATYCPFCGEKYPSRKSDLARKLAEAQ